VAAVSQEKRPNVAREHCRSHAIEIRIEHVIACAKKYERWRMVVYPHHRFFNTFVFVKNGLVVAKTCTEFFRISKWFRMKVDLFW
jgi:hypothetical protein